MDIKEIRKIIIPPPNDDFKNTIDFKVKSGENSYHGLFGEKIYGETLIHQYSLEGFSIQKASTEDNKKGCDYWVINEKSLNDKKILDIKMCFQARVFFNQDANNNSTHQDFIQFKYQSDFLRKFVYLCLPEKIKHLEFIIPFDGSKENEYLLVGMRSDKWIKIIHDLSVKRQDFNIKLKHFSHSIKELFT